MQLCLECRRANCNGEKCDDYKRLEKEIRMQKKNESAAPRMEIKPISAPPHDVIAQAHGLKLWNLTIEALDKLLDEEDMAEGSGSFAGMLKALKMQRFSLYGNRVDWHALEDE